MPKIGLMRKSGKSRLLRTLANNWFLERDSYTMKKKVKKNEKKEKNIGR